VCIVLTATEGVLATSISGIAEYITQRVNDNETWFTSALNITQEIPELGKFLSLSADSVLRNLQIDQL